MNTVKSNKYILQLEALWINIQWVNKCRSLLIFQTEHTLTSTMVRNNVICCRRRRRRSLIKHHNPLFQSTRKWPGSSRAPESPKITTRAPHTWRKSTSPCMLTPTSDNHRTTTTPVPGSSPSEPDVTSGIKIMVQQTRTGNDTSSATEEIWCDRMWEATTHPGNERSQICGTKADGQITTRKKKSYFINSWKKLHSSWKHLFRCMSFNNHILWGERDIQREKLKHYKPLTFH